MGRFYRDKVVAADVELGDRSAGTRVPATKVVRATLAELNAGKVIVPGVAGRQIVVTDAKMRAIGGALGAVTLIRLVESTSSGVVLSNTQATATQDTWLNANTANAVSTKMAVALTAGEGVKLDKTGNAGTVATHIDVVVTYYLA